VPWAGVALCWHTTRTATLKFYKSMPIHTSAIVRANVAINKGFSAQI